MSWLVLTWFLALGYVPEQLEKVDRNIQTLNESNIATVAQIGFEAVAWNRLSISADVENFQYAPERIKGFIPFRVDYTFSAALQLTDWLSVNLRHECDHIVAVGGSADGYESTETLVFLKITGKTTF